MKKDKFTDEAKSSPFKYMSKLKIQSANPRSLQTRFYK